MSPDPLRLSPDPVQTPGKTPGRLAWVDGAKCLSVLALALGHTPGYGLTYWIDTALLPLFWLAAGLTSSDNFSLIRRFRVLGKAYLVMSAICVLFTLVLAKGHLPEWWWLGVIYGRCWLQTDVQTAPTVLMDCHNAVLWFLPSLFTGYCMYRLLLYFKKDWQRWLASAVSLFVCWGSLRLPVLLPWGLDLALFVGPVMWAGRWLRKSDLLDRRPLTVFLTGGLTFALAHHFTGHTNMSVSQLGHCAPWGGFVTGVSGGVAILALCSMAKDTCAVKRLARLNADSLYIFGLQLVAFAVAGIFAAKTGLPLAAEVTLQMLLAILLGVAAGKMFSASPYLLFRKHG